MPNLRVGKASKGGDLALAEREDIMTREGNTRHLFNKERAEDARRADDDDEKRKLRLFAECELRSSANREPPRCPYVSSNCSVDENGHFFGA